MIYNQTIFDTTGENWQSKMILVLQSWTLVVSHQRYGADYILIL